jgi:hypothetical protein
MNAMVAHGGRTLQGRFQRLGPVQGRTGAEIVAAVGPPSGMTALPGGRVLLPMAGAGLSRTLETSNEGLAKWAW